jgi:hypothetical protein
MARCGTPQLPIRVRTRTAVVSKSAKGVIVLVSQPISLISSPAQWRSECAQKDAPRDRAGNFPARFISQLTVDHVKPGPDWSGTGVQLRFESCNS